MRKLPNGFRYSSAAIRECKRIASRATNLLQAKCRQDKEFCARLNKILDNERKGGW